MNTSGKYKLSLSSHIHVYERLLLTASDGSLNAPIDTIMTSLFKTYIYQPLFKNNDNVALIGIMCQAGFES